MTAHPQRRQIHKMAVVPRPSGKIRDPMPPRPSGKIKDPIPDPKPRPNIMAIAGFEFGPQITTLGDIPGLSNILHSADKGPSLPPPAFPNGKQPPGPGWIWKGAPGSQPGDGQGNWWNPATGQSIWKDANHPAPLGPHDDYRIRGEGKWRVFPDGRIEKVA
jgi:hypothetical protein